MHRFFLVEWVRIFYVGVSIINDAPLRWFPAFQYTTTDEAVYLCQHTELYSHWHTRALRIIPTWACANIICQISLYMKDILTIRWAKCMLCWQRYQCRKVFGHIRLTAYVRFPNYGRGGSKHSLLSLKIFCFVLDSSLSLLIRRDMNLRLYSIILMYMFYFYLLIFVL